MSENTNHSHRIAKNTLTLYVRMIFSMAVSLYTSRIVLEALGVTDFGIYGVVGGIVGMLGFLNSAMSSGTQRFLNYEMGCGNHGELKRIFSMSLSIHILIALIVFILAETVGLWFLNTQMDIPADRINAANWVYQFSILTAMLSLTQVPYSATIIAHERMKAYATIGIIEVLLRLIIAFLLTTIILDKLKLYAILTFAVSIIITLIYRLYCKRQFEECRYKFIKDRILFKKLTGFSGWNLIGSLTVVVKTQGQNILLNIFFGPIVNAAQSIANQVNNAVSSLVGNFQIAVNPQITKSYAAKEYDDFQNLIFKSAKISFFLLFILTAPILIQTPYILKIWLNIVPDYVVIFCQLTLISGLINSFSLPLSSAALASGNIKKYQLYIGLAELSGLPLAYIAFKLGYNPTSAFVIVIIIRVITLFMRLSILRKLVDLKVKSFCYSVVLRSIFTATIGIFPSIILKPLIPENFMGLVIIISITFLTSGLSIFFIGMTTSEKTMIASLIKKITKKESTS